MQIDKIKQELCEAVRGQDVAAELALAGVIAGGHVLLEGPVGVGKTAFAKALASLLGLEFRRIQLTPDLFPSDVTGSLRPEQLGGKLDFVPGPLFTQVLLADELNRASPRTQSALLEAMAEMQVTVDGVTRLLPKPFVVIATQNPSEQHGVFPLSESQLDRFLMRLEFGVPEASVELEIYKKAVTSAAVNTLPSPIREAVQSSPEQVLQMQGACQSIHVDQSLLKWMQQLLADFRKDERLQSAVQIRGGLQWLRCSQALAMIRKRSFVLPQDFLDSAVPVLAHRLQMSGGYFELRNQKLIVEECLEKHSPPR
jgi:MoxR-like ATPase